MRIFQMISDPRPDRSGRCSRFPALLAGCLLVCWLAGCAQCIGIQDLPAIDDAQGDGDDALGDNDAPRGDRLVPSHGATAEHLNGVTGALQVPEQSAITVNTDTGEISPSYGEGEPIRRSGKGVLDGIGFFPLQNGVAVVAVDALSVEDSLVASGTRPLVLLSRGDVSIRGHVLVSALGSYYSQRWEPRAGGGAGAMTASDQATGCAPGKNGFGMGGGGGGGFRHHGGAGGNSQDGLGGAGGLPADGNCSQDPEALIGGSGGGAAGPAGAGGAGGAGGGAVQITSFTSIEIIGEPSRGDESPIHDMAADEYPTGIFANGAGGGSGGGKAPNSGGGGGGAGAGGAILLEAPRIVIRDAYLTANGGAGGGGSSASSFSYDGDDGDPLGGSAFGGGGDSPGGDGGTGNIEPTAGKDGIDSAGGGGGSAGQIRLHVPPEQLVLEGAVISPAPSSRAPTWE